MNLGYWEQRILQLYQSQDKEDDRFLGQLYMDYDRQLKNVQGEISDYYAKYGTDDVREFRQVMQQQLNETERRQMFQDYNQFKVDHPELNDLMPVGESIYQLNRLEAIEMQTRMRLLELGSEEVPQYEEQLRQAYENGWMTTMDNLGNPQAMFGVSDELVRETLYNKWVDDRNFSDSIWTNKEKLIRTLNHEVRDGFIRGDSYNKMTKTLEHRFDVGKFEARRLIQTEANYVMNQANARAFQDQGIERYANSGVADDRQSDTCREMDGEIFYYRDKRIGLNAPPYHGFCRTMEIPIENDVANETQEQPEIEYTRTTNESMESKLSKEQNEQYSAMIEQMPAENRELWDRNLEDLHLENSSSKTNGHMNGSVRFGAERDLQDRQLYEKGSTFFHEFGHNIDFIEGRRTSGANKTTDFKLSNGKTLGETVFEEVRNTINKEPGKAREKRASVYHKLKDDYEENPQLMQSVSDLYGGATKNVLNVGVGHNKSYWELKPSKYKKYSSDEQANHRDKMLGTEAFAEMYAAESLNSQEVEVIKKWLPESYKGYKEVIGAMLKGM